MIQILFVVSAVVCILFLIAMIGAIVGNGINTPIPFLHLLDVEATTCYISCPALGFQVWFWAKHFGVLS